MSVVLVGAGPAYADALVAVVRAQDPAPAPGQGPEFGEASPIALVVVILLGIALVFLVRSMSKHLRKVPVSFDPPGEPERPAQAERAEEPPRPERTEHSERTERTD